jgi:biofilm PGA synthesis N-glycosyltransferase PgaC
MAWILVPETIQGLWRQRVRWAQGGVEVLKKHFDIFKDVRYRRIVPVYLEYFTGILWAHAFVLMVVLWLASVLTGLGCDIYNAYLCAEAEKLHENIFIYYSPLYPRWYGAILGLACLLEFMTSFIIDYRYEKKALSKYYFFVIWYPAGYWVLSSLAAIKGLFNVAFRRKGITAKWKSPDRGIHTLRLL